MYGVFQAAEMFMANKYINRLQSMIAQYMATRPVFALCSEVERQPGAASRQY